VGRRCLARPSAENPGVAREEGHSGSNRRGEPEHGSGEAPEPRVKYGTSSAGGAGRPANVSQVESTPEEDRRSKEKDGPERPERGGGAGRRQPKGQEEERQPAAGGGNDRRDDGTEGRPEPGIAGRWPTVVERVFKELSRRNPLPVVGPATEPEVG